MMFLNIGIALGQSLGGVMTNVFGLQALALIMAACGLINLLRVRWIGER